MKANEILIRQKERRGKRIMDKHIDKIITMLADRYKHDVIYLLNDEDGFLKVVEAAYNSSIQTEMSHMNMITNPSALNKYYSQDDFKNMGKAIAKELVQKLYTKDYISEAEYKEICLKKELK